MKRQLLYTTIFLLFLPILTKSQENTGPKKNKVAVFFMTPDSKNVADFERNLSRHAKEFHTGPNAVDIYEGLVGDRTGQFFMVSREPSTWAEIEANNEVRQKDHSTDWNKSISPLLEKEGPFQFYEMNSENSYLPANPVELPAVEKRQVLFIELNDGMDEDFFAGLKKIKEMTQKGNTKLYYYIFTRSFGTGTHVVVDIPLSKGFASLEEDPNTAWDKLFKNAFPKEDYKAWLKKFISTQKTFESSVMLYRKDLSSPTK